MWIDDKIRQELKKREISLLYEISNPISLNNEITIISIYHNTCTLKQDNDKIIMPYVYLSDEVLNKILTYLTEIK